MSTEIPAVDIWQLLFERTDRPFPDDHVIFKSSTSETTYTYAQVRTRSEQFGKCMKTHWNWRRGDVLVVMAPNHIETPSVAWGCHWAEGVVSPANPVFSVAELHRQLSSSRARGLVVHPDCLERGLEAAKMENLPADRVLVLGDSSRGPVRSVDEFIRSSQVDLSLTRTPLDPHDTAYLVFSSGTTARPKGVMVTHRNVVSGVLLQHAVDRDYVHWTKDLVLAVLPIYHIYGLVCLTHLPTWQGNTTVFMEKFSIEQFCVTIQNHAITHAYVAPPIVLHMAKSPAVKNYNLSSLRMATSGGAPLAAALIDEVYTRLKIPVRQAYGLSETASVTHVQRWTTWQTAPGSNGAPLPSLETKFLLSNGQPAGKGEEGELCIRGANVFKGYYDDPKTTAAALSSDGWFRTGDIGYEDSSGNLFITDRAKDMIKFKGYQVAPAELEDILLSHHSVSDAAVIGIFDQGMQTELPMAYIVLKNKKDGNSKVEKQSENGKEEEKTALEILEFLNNRAASHKRPRGGIVFIDSIPKSASGKILKRELRVRLDSVDREKRIGAVDYSRYRAKL